MDDFHIVKVYLELFQDKQTATHELSFHARTSPGCRRSNVSMDMLHH